MDAPKNTINFKALPAKLQGYEALYSFNRSIETTLECLDGLQRIGLLRHEDLHEYRVRLEHTRAEANQELMDSLQRYENEESTRLDGILSEIEKGDRDPDDVFFSARDRRQEIRQQIQDLQNALERQRSRRPAGKSRRRTSTRNL